MKKILLAIIASLLILLALDLTGVISLRPTLQPELGESFRLTKGDSATIKGTELTIKVTGFINSPCPENAVCVWSGQAVEYDVTYKNELLPNNFDRNTLPYNIHWPTSDYKTWAEFTVTKKDDD